MCSKKKKKEISKYTKNREKTCYKYPGDTLKKVSD